MEEMRRRLNAAEREAEEMSARLSSEELSYEAKLTEVYNAHRERVEKLSWDIGSRDEELQQVGRGDGEARGPGVTSLLTTPASDISARAAMEQWKTQWEEELSEKNSIDAEVLCQSAAAQHYCRALPSSHNSAMSASATHAALRI